MTKKVKYGASKNFARADRAPAAREGPGAGKGKAMRRGDSPRATRARSRRQTRPQQLRSSAREGGWGGGGMNCAPRACEARGDASSVRTPRGGATGDGRWYAHASRLHSLRTRTAAGSYRRCAACAAAQPSSAKRRSHRTKTRHEGKSAREGGQGRGIAGHLARARGAVAGRGAVARENAGDPSRAHMRALSEVPAPSDHV